MKRKIAFFNFYVKLYQYIILLFVHFFAPFFARPPQKKQDDPEVLQLPHMFGMIAEEAGASSAIVFIVKEWYEKFFLTT